MSMNVLFKRQNLDAIKGFFSAPDLLNSILRPPPYPSRSPTPLSQSEWAVYVDQGLTMLGGMYIGQQEHVYVTGKLAADTETHVGLLGTNKGLGPDPVDRPGPQSA